jgi:polyisoprenoid-binding protein YceI
MKLLSTLALSLVLAAQAAWAANYKIDADHSTVSFKVKHLAISTVQGKFATLEGTFSYDPKDPKSWATEATIKVGSINTNQAQRDQHLLNADFFDAQKFPEMRFKSTGVKDVSAAGFKLLGNLSIKNVTKPVVLDVQIGGTAADPWGNERAAFSATAKINRQDFGLSWSELLETGALVVGNDVNIEIEIEGLKQK